MAVIRSFCRLSLGLAVLLGSTAYANDQKFLNVSYDPTREFYQEFNQSFGKFWQDRTGQKIDFQQSHGGSGKQARSVIDGLQADVVTLALANDIDEIAKQTSLLPTDWQKRLPSNSSPYTSTIVFLVREGNPKGIKDWGDLVKPNVELIKPNPKTGGAPRWAYLAAWSWAKDQPKGSDATAREFIKKLYANVKVLDSGARGSLTTFAERGIGDVLITWENEAHLALKGFPEGKFQIVTPSSSILAEPSVAVVDKNAERNGTEKIALGYLNYLYSPLGQELAAKHYYRPRNPDVLAKYRSRFAPIKLFTIDEEFGGWAKAQATHFDNGGVYDQIAQENAKAR